MSRGTLSRYYYRIIPPSLSHTILGTRKAGEGFSRSILTELLRRGSDAFVKRLTLGRMIRAFAALEKGPEISNWQYEPRPLQPEDVELRIVASGV